MPKRKKTAIRREEIELHGHRVSYRIAGEGPPILLIHGIAGRSEQWLDTMNVLAEDHTVVAPDLLGHGRSAKPRGDYSLGAYASGLRDLLAILGPLPPDGVHDPAEWARKRDALERLRPLASDALLAAFKQQMTRAAERRFSKVLDA
jgi:hypothetical protein